MSSENHAGIMDRLEILELLQSKHHARREKGCRMLFDTPMDRVLADEIVSLMRDPVELVRNSAAIAVGLWNRGRDWCRQELLESALNGSEQERSTALIALIASEWSSLSMEQAMRQLVSSDDTWIQHLAILALGHQPGGIDRALGTITSFWDEYLVRRAVAQTLFAPSVSARNCTALRIKLLSEDDEGISSDVLRSMRKGIYDDSEYEAVFSAVERNPHPFIRAQVLNALGHEWPPWVEMRIRSYQSHPRQELRDFWDVF